MLAAIGALMMVKVSKTILVCCFMTSERDNAIRLGRVDGDAVKPGKIRLRDMRNTHGHKKERKRKHLHTVCIRSHTHGK